MISVPRVFAHRGSSADAPENTIAAFRRARLDRADGVELDVMRCATGEVVVFHDDELQRLCGVAGPLRRQSLSALRELKVSGEPIPTLDEVIEELGPDMLLNVELKALPGLAGRFLDDGLPAAVAEIVLRHALTPRVIVSSFDPVQLKRFRACAPAIDLGFLFGADQALPLRRGWPATLLRTAAVHPALALVDEARVNTWHRRQQQVNVWTVDEPAEIAYLATIGVDGIITNRPAQARAALASWAAREVA